MLGEFLQCERLTSQGTAYLFAQQQLTTQAIVLTLNRVF
jgi:hypothetical protein